MSYNEMEGRFFERRRKLRAAKLRAKADQLDPDGAFRPVAFEELPPLSVTWEQCCQVPYFNTLDVGAPLYYRAGDGHRMTDETTAVPVEHTS